MDIWGNGEWFDPNASGSQEQGEPQGEPREEREPVAPRTPADTRPRATIDSQFLNDTGPQRAVGREEGDPRAEPAGMEHAGMEHAGEDAPGGGLGNVARWGMAGAAGDGEDVASAAGRAGGALWSGDAAGEDSTPRDGLWGAAAGASQPGGSEAGRSSGSHRSPAYERRAAGARRSNPLFQVGGPIEDPFAAPATDAALGPGVAAATLTGGALQTFSGSAIGQTERQRASQARRRDWRSRALAVGLAMLAALLICMCGLLLLNPALQTPGFNFARGQRDATETAVAATATATANGVTGPGGNGSTPGANGAPNKPGSGAGAGAPTPTPTHAPGQPDATPTPNPRGTTVAFLVANQQVSSPGGMTACGGGCDIPGQAYSNQQTFSVNNVQSTFYPQTKLIGQVTATNASKTQNWSASGYVFSGGGYNCEPHDVFVGTGSSATFPCNIDVSSPQSLPSNTISGNVNGVQVSYKNTNPFSSNEHWQVTAQDCGNAIGNTQDQGKSWGQSWVNSQLPGGWQLASNPPEYYWDNVQCPQDQQQQYFNASSVTHVHDDAFNPADAQRVASSRLSEAVPSGYTLKGGSGSTCSPTVSSLSGDTINVNCSDSGTAIYVWTDAMKAQLAQAVAGKSTADATSICNGAQGVQAGSCQVTVSGGGGTTVTGQITVQANIP